MYVIVAFLIGMAILSGYQPLKTHPDNLLEVVVCDSNNVKTRQPVKPLTEFLDDRIVKQTYDYSCGSSALATILKYHLGENLTERQVIQGLLHYGDADKITERRAFSLLDMKRFVEILGYKGIGYKATLDDLKTLNSPGIIPIKIFEYRHFTVFKGIYKNHIFLVDPWRGHTSYSLEEFLQMWYNNVVFVVYPKGETQVLTALKLKEEDLRILDEDANLQLLRNLDYSFKNKVNQRRNIDDVQGEYQFYKH